ncbi:MAG: nitrite/sulfite reductase [Cytophagales bacterium]|nr:nitrite/sulfite reductase [Cytophagales bacterium]
MYQYTDFDKQFVKLRAAQYRDQLERHLAGQLLDDDFRPLRLQNGWYVQRHAPMLRVAVPYGELSSAQLRVLATIARDFDKVTTDEFGAHFKGRGGYGHFTTRQNIQYNWIALRRSADVMDLLASVNMHGIQTSGNCIRNITSDALAGIAPDEIVDPRPFCEILRQWSTLHPEFAFLPRKFKFAVTGAHEDRAATAWHDVGLHVIKNAAGEVGFRVLVGGGMGRTPVIGTVIREFLPWQEILNYCEAVIRVYNRYGRRDNIYKARIKILVKSEGQKYIDDVEAEYAQIVANDGANHTITQAEFDRVAAFFAPPTNKLGTDPNFRAENLGSVPNLSGTLAHDSAYQRWLTQNVRAHKNPALRAVTISFKHFINRTAGIMGEGYAPGDVFPEQLDAVAKIAEQFSCGEVRVTHDQNLMLPWVHADNLDALWLALKDAGLARTNIGLLTDMIACPGGDYCALANARSIPIAEGIMERYEDLDELHDIGDIDLHISGCINSCGHHHSGHIGILGVDKDGKEWYQVTLGGSDGSTASGSPVAGKVVGPSFSAEEVTGVIEAVIENYREHRIPKERFIDTFKRVGMETFKAAANAARHPAALEVAA